MKSLFLSPQPIDERHGGGAVMLALLRKEHAEGTAGVIEIHRGQPSALATRHFRSMALPALGLMQLLLPVLPFDFFSRFSFGLLGHLRSLGRQKVTFNYNQMLIYPLLARRLESEIVVHDVMHDMWRSHAGVRRPFWRLVRFWERRLVRWLPATSTLVFLSDKDRDMLADDVRCQVRVLDLPSLLASESVGNRTPERRSLRLGPGVRVGLLGAWHRPENSSGAQAFLDALEPEVREGLRVRIAGPGSEQLSDGPSIEKLGFVDDLSEFFDAIDIFVAPLDSGAGVKIKVLNALEHGVPLFLTAKAVEGINLPADHPHVVERDCRQLAGFFNRAYVRS
jgi:hypothetical protein